MNIAIIGSKNSKRLAEVLYEMFDTVKVVSYDEINEFRQAMMVRALDFHRMILFQEGLDRTDVSDEDLFDFQDMILTNYAAMNLITISKDADFCKYLGEMFCGNNFAHFCVRNLKAGMLVDIAHFTIKELEKKYSDFLYKAEIDSVEETLNADSVAEYEPKIEEEEDIPNYIPNTTKKKPKFSLRNVIFHPAPKYEVDLVKKDGLTSIGQGFTQSEFSEAPESVDFNSNNEENKEEETEFDYFGNDTDLGLGIENFDSEFETGETEEIEHPIVHLEKEDIEDSSKGNSFENEFDVDESKNIFDYQAPKEAYVPFDIHKLDKEPVDFEPTLDIAEKEDTDYFSDAEEPEDINIPDVSEGFSSLKRTMEETDVKPFEDVQDNNLNNHFNMNMEDAEVSAFTGDIDSLMAEYDEEKRKQNTIEVPVPMPTQNAINSVFRNKNGIKIIIVSGDRRVGSTKLALNLANKYANRESKVLYVDMDRNRHGSLGYIDLDTLTEEPEHIQNGLIHLKSANILKNVCHYYKKGRFFVLTSMYGNYADDSTIMNVQNILASQHDFSTIVIDCPLEDLHLLRNIISFSHVLFCVEDDKVGIINFITTMDSSFDDDNLLYNFFEKSYFVIGRRGNIVKFQKELNYIVELFDLDESACKWNNVEIIGTLKETDKLAERTGD